MSVSLHPELLKVWYNETAALISKISGRHEGRKRLETKQNSNTSQAQKWPAKSSHIFRYFLIATKYCDLRLKLTNLDRFSSWQQSSYVKLDITFRYSISFVGNKYSLRTAEKSYFIKEFYDGIWNWIHFLLILHISLLICHLQKNICCGLPDGSQA